MFLKEKWLLIALVFTLLLSIIPSSTCAANLDHITISTQPNIGSFYVDDFSEIVDVIGSKEVKNWIGNHTDVDPDNFKFVRIEEKNLDDKSYFIKFYDQNKDEIYYTITPGSTSVVESSFDKSRSILLPQIGPNHFRIVNGLGKTVNRVGVVFYRMFHDVPIAGDSSNRYNLPSGGVLNYNPSPEWSHVTIGIDVEDQGVLRVKPDIWHWCLPLCTWHTATIKQNKGYYLDFS